MGHEKFIDTFSDDLLCVEEAYRIYLQNYPEAEAIIWPSLCRVYTLVTVSCVDFFLEFVLNKAGIPQRKNVKLNIEALVKAALKRDSIPREMDMPKKIRNYVHLRELRHFIVHRDPRKRRETRVKSIKLHLNVEKFTEKELNIIKQIIRDIINLIGMCLVIIENPQLSQDV